MLALSYSGRTRFEGLINRKERTMTPIVVDLLHIKIKGTDTKDSDGDTSYVDSESFLDDWDKWIED